MLGLTMLPLAVWVLLQAHPPVPLHRCDAEVAQALLVLDVYSVAVLIALFGWFQVDIDHRMETPAARPRDGSNENCRR
jgi:hypothetical protein